METVMGADDKIKNAAEDLKGKAKETAGKARRRSAKTSRTICADAAGCEGRWIRPSPRTASLGCYLIDPRVTPEITHRCEKM
jgi:hypothetical protein